MKAFILPKEGVKADKNLEDSLKEFVKTRLEAHAYPREVAFLKDMPMTKTGKILKTELHKIHEEQMAAAKKRDTKISETG